MSIGDELYDLATTTEREHSIEVCRSGDVIECRDYEARACAAHCNHWADGYGCCACGADGYQLDEP